MIVSIMDVPTERTEEESAWVAGAVMKSANGGIARLTSVPGRKMAGLTLYWRHLVGGYTFSVGSEFRVLFLVWDDRNMSVRVGEECGWCLHVVVVWVGGFHGDVV